MTMIPLPFIPFSEEFFVPGAPSPREIAHLQLVSGMEMAFFPSVGPLFPCHTLLVPADPVRSYAELSAADVRASFEAAVQLRAIMKAHQEENIVIGEHGAGNPGSCKSAGHHGGACTDHAHWHFSTCRGSPIQVLENYRIIGGNPEIFTDPTQLCELKGQPYFMLCPFPQAYPQRLQIYIWRNPQDRFGGYTRQFFRRAVYAAGHGLDIHDMIAGRNEGWDWRKNPDLITVSHITHMLRADLGRPNYLADPDSTQPHARAGGSIANIFIHEITR